VNSGTVGQCEPFGLACLPLCCQAIDDRVKKEVDEAVVHAKNDPEPSPEELYTHVYSQPPPGFHVRGCDPFTYYDTKWWGVTSPSTCALWHVQSASAFLLATRELRLCSVAGCEWHIFRCVWILFVDSVTVCRVDHILRYLTWSQSTCLEDFLWSCFILFCEQYWHLQFAVELFL